ncbi:BHMG1 protein, partial [Atlantisia rogersi]|nr:BHMG1 protein [Atlantisia rogersi]
LTEPYWETVDWEGVMPQSPSPRRKGHLGLSPSLLASPSPPASPGGVVRGAFGGGCDTSCVCTPHPPTQHHRVTPPLLSITMSSPQLSFQMSISAHSCGVAPRGRGPKAPPQPRKKCVNGFIMFCRLNRKSFMRTHPGLSSRTTTQELAKLWHSLSLAERRQY